MTFDLAAITQSKRAYRQRLASLPIETKLAMLDAMRERAVAIHAATNVDAHQASSVKKISPPYLAVPERKK